MFVFMSLLTMRTRYHSEEEAELRSRVILNIVPIPEPEIIHLQAERKL